jgi:triosephosphate isomerase
MRLMRRPFISANWKLQKTVGEAEAFIDAFLPMVEGVTDVDIVIAPVFTALHASGKKLKGTNVSLASQNVYFEESGAYTGEVAPGMLVDVGCQYAIVGHSERRGYFNETDDILNKKAKAAIAAGLKVIFCIGESLAQREGGQTNDHLAGQLTNGLKDIDLADIVVAYEPIWAIGTGVTASPQQAQDTHAFVRGHLRSMSDKADDTRILYGGSVKPDNVKELMALEDVDGALVGGASLKPDSFASLVNFGG